MESSQDWILLSPPHMTGEEIDYVNEAFSSNWVAPLGPQVDAFEREIATHVGVPGAMALSSGTAAIHLALRLAGVVRGDTILCSSLTFVGSVNPVLYLGGEPIFIDSEPGTWNISPAVLERALEREKYRGTLPKAAILVNLYGQSADLEPLLEICHYYGVTVIEDAAESLGATYKTCPSGSWGDFGVFSFNGNKIITTSGGGMLLSKNIEALDKARFWATQAREPARYYQHREVGYNYRLSNVLAAIGRAQFKYLDARVNTRRKIFERYKDELEGYPGLSFMPEAEYGRSTRWLTALTINPEFSKNGRDELLAALEQHNIEARPVWKPMHLQPLFRGSRFYAYQEGKKGVSEVLFEQGICLPSGSSMTEKDQEKVINSMQKHLGGK